MIDEQKCFFLQYDITSLSYSYGRLGPLLDQSQQGYLLTSGSSTTASSALTGKGTLGAVRPGDFVYFVVGQALVRKKVLTKPTDESITFAGAIDLGAVGVPWFLKQFDEGTADTDGWQNVANTEGKAVKIDINDIGGITGGVDMSIEVRNREDTAKPYSVIEKNYTANGSDVIEVTEPCTSIRVGLKAGSGAGGGASDIDVDLVTVRQPH